MKNLMTVVAASACAASFSASAFADADVPAADNKANAETMEEEDSGWITAGLDLDFNTAYVWHNVVQTDKPVFQPCAWFDLTFLDPFRFGGYYFLNWDLSDDRRGADKLYSRRLNESDYNVHVGLTPWTNEDGDMSLDFELGHEWFTYLFDHGAPSTREIYLKGTFENPVVTVYGVFSWMYDDVQDVDSGCYYEIGFNKEFELCDSLTLGLDWSTGMADADYHYFLTGVNENGFLGTTAKAYLNWAVTDWLSLVGTLAYTGLLDSDVRHEYNAGNGWRDRDDKDVIWGGVSAKLSF